MTDDIYDAVMSDDPPPNERTSLTLMADNLAPIADLLRSALVDDAQSFALRLEAVTPEDREAVNRLRAMLESLVLPLKARVAAIDQHALLAMHRLNADQLPMPGGRAIRLKKPDGTYQVDEQGLRRALSDAVEAGLVTAAEVNDAITEEVHYKVNHTRLNYLARHRGDTVADAIAGHRKKLPPDPTRARVEWPEPLREEDR